MKRRKFIKSAGYSSVSAAVVSPFPGNVTDRIVTDYKVSDTECRAKLSVKGNIIYIETPTLSAVMEKGVIISLIDRSRREEFIEKPDSETFRALQLIYGRKEKVNVNEEKFGQTVTHQISDQKAEIWFNSWDGDGVISVSVDDETGDLLVEPSAYSSRPGVLACRWNISGIKRSLRIVAPLFQGVILDLDDKLIQNNRWEWPFAWEAGLVIFQSEEGGFWVRTQDNSYRFKALQTGTESDPYVIGLDSEAYGPLDNNMSAGGLCWRINTYAGNWKVPAESYRQWYWKAYNLDAVEAKRQKWINNIRLAVSWCPGKTDILDALARKVQPNSVLIHFPDWRTDRYDENYPDFFPDDNAKIFIKKGMEMGFHIMPHFNSIDMDPSNPVYSKVRDFPYRSVETKQLQGWSWYNSRVIGVPESNSNRLNNRDKKVMVKIHPGLSMWRSILGKRILDASKELSLGTVFIDVTLCIWNIHNSIVETMTPVEGMQKLIRHVSELGTGLVVAGEGLNEITAQGLSFAQVHLFRSSQESTSGLERTGGCNLNELLFGRLCRTFGYSRLGGKDADEELRMKIHSEHGAIPTLTIRSAEEIINPNPAVKRILELAAG
ncbi:MAG: DUF6259 domain-containing protein [Bacteroidales bacterium]|jgi:hypothetical protein|nr:DUF6259 domain-containing protein [Bacteroidales bacterium]